MISRASAAIRAASARRSVPTITGRVVAINIDGSRRWFYYIPASGEPTKIVHSIERYKLDALPGKRVIYRGWEELHAHLAGALESGGFRVAALIKDGYTSFKIYMTYETLKLDDRQIISVLALARDEGALVMVHAENSDCITWLTEELERTHVAAHAVAMRDGPAAGLALSTNRVRPRTSVAKNRMEDK